MSGIDQKQSELAFHDVVDGFPINPCGFHRYMSDLFVAQPSGKFHNVPCHSPERANFLVNPASVIETANASLDASLMHIKAATTGIDRLHVFSPYGAAKRWRTSKIKTLYYACSAREGKATVLGSWRCPGQTAVRARSITEIRPPSIVQLFKINMDRFTFHGFGCPSGT